MRPWWRRRAATVAAAAAIIVAALVEAAGRPVAAAEVPLGALSTLAHDVAGNVVVINERVVEVRNFVYDGTGPAAFWWAGSGDRPDEAGSVVPDVPGCGRAALPAADGSGTVRLELPPGQGVSMIDYLSVWCETFRVDFGSIVFADRHAEIDGAIEPAPPSGFQCATTGGGGGAAPAPAPVPAAPVSTGPPVSLGSLSTLAHDVEGEVWAINARVLEVRNFRYDGTGPAAFWWAGNGTRASSSGVVVKEVPGCGAAPLPAADGTVTVRVELPADMDVTAIDYLSVWCEEFRTDFGSVVWGGRHAEIDPALGTAPADGYTCFGGDGGGGGGGGGGATPPANALANCVALNRRLQVRWEVADEEVRFSLHARMSPDEWAGFGVSGAADATRMTGSDVTIASVDAAGAPTVHDFHMSTRSPCDDSGAGVCPDTDALRANGTDDVSGVSSIRDSDVVTVDFVRPVRPTDVAPPGLDKLLPVTPGTRTFISWALGPLDEATRLPRFHGERTDYPSGGRDVALELGRPPADECGGGLVPTAGGGEAAPVTAWARPPIVGVSNFDVVIGPSGGPHGYGAIHAGHVPWGIAYYVNDLLVPVLVVERGKTYTFSTRTGDERAVAAKYHPVYITESDSGGFFLNPPAVQATERTFAGLDQAPNGTFSPSVVSPICEYRQSSASNPETDFATYAATLSLDCGGTAPAAVQPGRLSWTVAADTPNTVYYQCTEHRNLGFRIAVFDAGTADPEVYNALVADAPLFSTAAEGGSGGGAEAPSCQLRFGDQTRTFEGCVTLSNRIELFWTLNAADETADMAFRTLQPAGYASVGWPEAPPAMVPADAVIAYAVDGSPTVSGYRLNARNTAGVVPDGDRLGLTDAAAEVAPDGTLSAVFTRPYAPPSGSPALSAGQTDFIWAIGAAPSSASTLQRHSFREGGSVDLSATNGGGVRVGRLPVGAYWISHAVLLSVPWLILIPSAILFARYFKGTAEATTAWFPFHRAVNTVAVVAILVGWIMGLVRGDRSEMRHLVLGCVVVPLAVAQVAAGVARPAKDAGSRRSLWYAAHSWAGRAAVVLAVANVFLGMATARVDAGTGWKAAVGAYVGALGLLVVLLEAWKWKSQRRQD